MNPTLLNAPSTDKETWEPTIAHLFDIQAGTKAGVHVGEVWAGDVPNHGHAAVLNEHALLKRPEGICMFILFRGGCWVTDADLSIQQLTFVLVKFRHF